MKICADYRKFKQITRKYKGEKSHAFYVSDAEQAMEVLRSSSRYCGPELRDMLTVFLIIGKDSLVKCCYEFGILKGVLILKDAYGYVIETEGKTVLASCTELVSI